MRYSKFTINVFLDTQVFDSQQYDFGNKTFQRLIELREAGAIKLFTTQIVRREIEGHLKKRSTEAFQHFEKLRKHTLLRSLDIPPLQNIHAETSPEAIHTHLVSRFNEYWARLGVKELPTSPETLQRVMDKYFSVSPPFDTGDKKAEFPDAVAADAIIAWCQQKDEKMWVVSGDDGWRKVCEETKCLTYKDRLSELLNIFPDPELVKLIKEGLRAMESHLIQSVDGELAGEVVNAETEFALEWVSVTEAKMGDIFVLDAFEGSATVQVDFHFDIEAAIKRKGNFPPNYYHTAEAKIVSKNFSQRVTIEIYLSYEKGNPTEITIDYEDMVAVDSDLLFDFTAPIRIR